MAVEHETNFSVSVLRMELEYRAVESKVIIDDYEFSCEGGTKANELELTRTIEHGTKSK